MKFSTLEDLKRVEPQRKAGFMDACLKRGTLTARGVEWPDEVHAEIRARFALDATERKRLGLGDIVGAVATPIARALNLDCIDKETNQLKPTSPCQKRKEALNRIHL